jgi:hypothetical protein
MGKLRTKDKVALAIAVFTALSVVQDYGLIGVVLAVVINIAIFYVLVDVIAIIVAFFRRRRK